MNEEIVKEADLYYTEKTKQFGSGPQASDWNSVEAQETRFRQIIQILPDDRQEHFSICDYGCGLGDLYDYIGTKYSAYDYMGLDASSEIIKKAKNVRKGGTYLTGYRLTEKVDYIVSSGVFNVRQNTPDDEWLKYIIDTISMFNDYSDKGFSFNCLTKYSDAEYMKDYLYYADPLVLFDYCKKHFSRNVALLHDYELYDFTILVRKTF